MERFGTWNHTEGLESAKLNTMTIVARLSEKAVARGKKRSPLDLLWEYSGLYREVSKLRKYQERKDWLCTREKISKKAAADLANYFGSELAERVLAYRHGMSHSAVHKALAQAVREVQASRKLPADLSRLSFVRKPAPNLPPFSFLRNRRSKTR